MFSVSSLRRHERALALCLVAVLLVVRRWHLFLNPHFFAEDGTIFWLQNYEQGFRALWMPYAGYLHFIPRLVAALCGLVDPAHAPLLFLYFASLAHLLTIAWLFSPRISLPHKTVLAALTVLVPHTTEVFANITNMQWVLALGLFLLALAEDAASWRQRLFDSAALVAVGLTGPFAIPLFPVFVLRYLRRRSRDSLLLCLLCLACATIQGAVMQVTMLHSTIHEYDFTLLMAALGFRVWGELFTGFGFSANGAPAFWLLVGALLTSASLAAAFRWRRSHLPSLTLAWMALVAVVALKYAPNPKLLAPAINGDRYFYVPHVLLLWSLILLTDKIALFAGSFRALAVVAIVAGHAYFIDEPVAVPPWKTQLEPVREELSFRIPIAPEGWNIEHDASRAR